MPNRILRDARVLAALLLTMAKPVEVRVDHPFLFAIVIPSSVDSSGTTCLFLGHVTDPR